MKSTAALICLFCIALQAPAQVQIKINENPRVDTFKNIYILVDTFRTDTKGLILDPQHIESLEMFNSRQAVKKYGDQAADGAIIVHMKKNVTLLRLNAFLDKLGQFTAEDKKCGICIDGKLIDKPDLILIDESQINAVHTFYRTDIINCEIVDQKFLNISTKRGREANPL